MAVTQEYLDYVTDQLGALGPVSARRMFGGAGLYRNGLIFGIVANDTLYLKVDDSNRDDYLAAGMQPFRPYPNRPQVMPYYAVPADALEDRDRLCEWAQKALAAVGRRASTAVKRDKGRK